MGGMIVGVRGPGGSRSAMRTKAKTAATTKARPKAAEIQSIGYCPFSSCSNFSKDEVTEPWPLGTGVWCAMKSRSRAWRKRGQ